MSAVVPRSDRAQLKARLDELVEEISADLAQVESAQRKELLSDFVSDLFLSMAKQDQQDLRRQKQAEGIAAAKAKGVHFGRSAKPLPDNFDACYEAWLNGQLTQAQAAERCGISRTAFYRAVNRMKEAEGCSA